MHHPFMEGMAEALGARGVATLRFQFPYTEAGRRSPDPAAALQATVRAAVAAAARELDVPLIAGGKSLGGRMTSLAQADRPLPGVRGLVFLGFPLHAPRRPNATRAEHLERVQVPMLFLQGARDDLADLTLLAPLLERLGPRATLHVVEGGDHSFRLPRRAGRSEADVLSELADVVRGWLEVVGEWGVGSRQKEGWVPLPTPFLPITASRTLGSMPSYWILKTEPTTYSFADLERDGRTVWDGVRNNLALRHIGEMRQGDQAMVYHTGGEKAIVGLARIASSPYADPKANDERLVVVDLEPARRLPRPVSLAEIKADAAFRDLPLVRMPRLSVMPVDATRWKRLLAMAGGRG
jgi:hypothetical protein